MTEVGLRPKGERLTTGILVQLIFSGMTTGAVYGLVALGFITIYRASNVLNLAQGEFVTLGALTTIFFLNRGMPYLMAGVSAVIVTMMVGIVMERAVIRPLRKKPVLTLIMVTIGLSFFLQGASGIIFGGDPQSLPPFISHLPVVLADTVRVSSQSLFVLGLAIVLVVLLSAGSRGSYLGKAMEAVATDRQGAALVGIDRHRICRIAFAVSAAVGALAGIFITPVYFAQYNAGTLLGLKGFAAAIIGGWGSYAGAMLGGLTLGILEAVSVGLIPAGYKDAVAFAALILMLYFLPKGILGSRALSEARK